MRVSVVTTSFNHARFLGDALRSVQQQTHPAYEHIVVDGASSDGTVPFLHSLTGPEWSHLRWSSKPDRGQTQAMNKGLRSAAGDIVGWLNSDDRYHRDCLQSVVHAFARNPSIDVLYGDYAFIDASGSHIRTRREIAFNPLVLFYHRVPHIPTTSTFFRRRIFDDGFWLNESLQHAMDHELFIRLARAGYRFQHLAKVLADFRLHPASKTCTVASLQLAEAQWARLQHTPAGQRIHNPSLRHATLGALQGLAAAARYSEKFLRGYYFRDHFDLDRDGR